MNEARAVVVSGRPVAQRRQGNTLPIAAACVAVFGLYLEIFAVPPLIPVFVDDLGQSHEQAGLLMTVATAAFGGASAFAGIFSHWLAPLRLVGAGIALASVATFACSLTSSYAALLVLRGVVGIGGALVYPIGISFVASARPDRAQTGIGAFFAALYLGIAIAFLLGPLFDDGEHWRWLLRSYAFAGAAAALVVAAAARGGVRSAPAGSRGGVAQTARLLREPRLLLASTLLFLFMFVLYGFYTWYPPFLAETGRFGGGRISVASALMAFAAIPAAILSGRIGDRTGRSPLVATIGLLSAALLLAAVAADGSFPVLTLVAIAVSFGSASAAVPLFALPTRAVAAETGGAASALATVAGFGGAVLATYAGGFLVGGSSNYTSAFAVFAGVGCGTALVIPVVYAYLARGRGAGAPSHTTQERCDVPHG